MSQYTPTQPHSAPNKVAKHGEGQTPTNSRSDTFSASSASVAAASSVTSGSKAVNSLDSYKAAAGSRFDRDQTEKSRSERTEHSYSGFSSSTSSSSPHRPYQHSTSPHQSSFSSRYERSSYQGEESRNRPPQTQYGSSGPNNASTSTYARNNVSNGQSNSSTENRSGFSSNTSHESRTGIGASSTSRNGSATLSNNHSTTTASSTITTTPEISKTLSSSAPSAPITTPALSSSSDILNSSLQSMGGTSARDDGRNGNLSSSIPGQPNTRLISLQDFYLQKQAQKQSASRGPISSYSAGRASNPTPSISAALATDATQPPSNASVTQVTSMSDTTRPPSRGDALQRENHISEPIAPPRDPLRDTMTPDTFAAIASTVSTRTPTPIAATTAPEETPSPEPVVPAVVEPPINTVSNAPQEPKEPEQPVQNSTAMDITEPPAIVDVAEASAASTPDSRSENNQITNGAEAAAKRTASAPEKAIENEVPEFISRTLDFLSKDDKDRPNYPFKAMNTERALEFADTLAKPQDGGTTSSAHEDAPQTVSVLAGAAARWRKFCKWHGVQDPRKGNRYQTSASTATTPSRSAAAAPVAMDISDVPSSAMMSAVAASSARSPGQAPRRLSALSPAPTQPPKSLTSKVNLDFAKLYITQKVQSLGPDEQTGSSPAALARMASVIQNRFETYLSTMTPNFAVPVPRGGENDDNRPGARRSAFTSRIAVAGITRDTFHALKRVLKAHYPLTDVTMTELMDATIFLVDTNRAFDWDQYIAILHNIMVVRSEWAELIVTRHVLLPIDSFLIPESKSPHFSPAHLYERDLFIWNPPITTNHRRNSNKASETRVRALISFACRFLGIEYRYWDAALDTFEEDPKQYVLVVPEWFAGSEEALQQPATNFSDIWSYSHLLHYMSTCSAPKPPENNL